MIPVDDLFLWDSLKPQIMNIGCDGHCRYNWHIPLCLRRAFHFQMPLQPKCSCGSWPKDVRFQTRESWLCCRLNSVYQLIVSYLLGWFFDGFSRFCNKHCWLWHGRADAGSVKAWIYSGVWIRVPTIYHLLGIGFPVSWDVYPRVILSKVMANGPNGLFSLMIWFSIAFHHVKKAANLITTRLQDVSHPHSFC